MLDRANAVRDGEMPRPSSMSYYDLLKDPWPGPAHLRSAGLLTAEAQRAMEQVLARDVQNRYGRHVYRVARPAP